MRRGGSSTILWRDLSKSLDSQFRDRHDENCSVNTVTNKSFEFFHNSHRIWQIELNKFRELTRDWTQITSLVVSHSNHYTRMFSVRLLRGCNQILFMHGWLCPICLIHLNGRKSLHLETSRLIASPKTWKHKNWLTFPSNIWLSVVPVGSACSMFGPQSTQGCLQSDYYCIW